MSRRRRQRETFNAAGDAAEQVAVSTARRPPVPTAGTDAGVDRGTVPPTPDSVETKEFTEEELRKLAADVDAEIKPAPRKAKAKAKAKTPPKTSREPQE